MTAHRPSLPRALRGARREDGGASVEFVLLFPLFVMVFMCSFEASMLLVRQVMFDRAVDLAAWRVRMDSEGTVTQNELMRDICARTKLIADCETNVTVELSKIDQATYALPGTTQDCVSHGSGVVPTVGYETDRNRQLILLRACVNIDPVFPGRWLGAKLVSDDGAIKLITSTAFVVEPG